MFDREDDITMVSPCRRIDITIDSDDIASGLHRMVALDLRNKLVEIHLVSASRGHEGWSTRHFLSPMQKDLRDKQLIGLAWLGVLVVLAGMLKGRNYVARCLCCCELLRSGANPHEIIEV